MIRCRLDEQGPSPSGADIYKTFKDGAVGLLGNSTSERSRSGQLRLRIMTAIL